MALTAGAIAPTRTFPLGALAAAVAAAICALPAVAVFAMGFGGEKVELSGLAVEGVAGTVVAVLVAGALAAALGAGAAWLVTMCAFPGRALFEWLLVLPLAAPLYVLGYAYGALTGPLGPLPVPLTGLPGACFVYVIGLYPYVYLSARAAFLSQSVCALEAARSLGASPWRSFAAVALPMAWPAIAAGAALASMEIASDFGAAAYFGATTVTTAIFHAWFSRGEPELALRLAAALLAGAFVLLALERAARGRRSFAGHSARWRPLPRFALSPIAAFGASVFCGVLVFSGALLPLAWLARLAVLADADLGQLAEPLLRSLILASAGAALTLGVASLLAAATRAGAGRYGLFAAAMGYAAPGAVTALGALSLFGAAREAGLIAGLSGAASVALLLWVYVSRFAAAGAQPLEAGLARVTPSMSEAGRTLTSSGMRRFIRIELPVAAPGAFAAALIVFVEILKELPATLILRPFDFETLATRAHAYAADERLFQAAAPALLLALAGLAPVIILSRELARARAGGRQ